MAQKNVKMYCIMAQESVELMKASRGKMCAQAGHAFVHAALLAARDFPDQFDEYINGSHAFKIVLITDTVEDLERLHLAYQDKCATVLIKDKGFTIFDQPTVTCLGIGPLPDNLKGDDLKQLKTFY